VATRRSDAETVTEVYQIPPLAETKQQHSLALWQTKRKSDTGKAAFFDVDKELFGREAFRFMSAFAVRASLGPFRRESLTLNGSFFMSAERPMWANG
jgi:hypothetical protein